MRLYLKICFLGVMFLHVVLAKWTVFIPVRTMALFVFLGVLFLVYNRQVIDFVRRHPQIFLVFAAMAFIGGSLAVLNGEQLYTLAEFFLRNSIQPLLILLCTYLAARTLGLAFTTNVILAFTAASALIAIFQFVGIDWAWDLRRFLGTIYGDAEDEAAGLRAQLRPLGLALSPINFSYQLVSGYLVALLLYRHGLLEPRMYVIFTLIAFSGAAANGTRSLVAGILFSECFQLILRAQLKSLFWLTGLALLGAVGFYYLEMVGSRVTSVDDASAVGRLVLMQFGLKLFLNNPFGYGWGVTPGEYAWLFWEELSHLPRAEVTHRLGIHNGFINFLLTYGLLGVCIIAFVAAMNSRVTVAFVMVFPAYLINSALHNAGVFIGDMYFWFAFAIFLYLREYQDDTLVDSDRPPRATAFATDGPQ